MFKFSGITLIFLVLSIVFLLLYHRQKAAYAGFLRISSRLQRVNSIESLLAEIRAEVERQGGRVVTFLQRNVNAHTLESGTDVIPMFEVSAFAKSFFTLTPQVLSDKNPIDRRLISSVGAEAVAIPFYLSQEAPCWKILNCDPNNSCRCNRRNILKCWITSDTFHRDGQAGSYIEKLGKCIMCKSFLPFGVFIVVKSSNPKRLMEFINSTFSGVLRGNIAFEKAVYSSTVDSLTGVTNKGSFLQHLSISMKLADRHALPLSLCMLDIDHFKKFNDSYGHLEGDNLLKELTAFIGSMLRESDELARYGGEEFSIVLPGADKAGAHAAMDRVRQSVANHHIFCGDKRITISMGVASMAEDEAPDVDDLIRKADAALYASKVTRNAVTAYKPGMSGKFDGGQREKQPAKKRSVKKAPDQPEMIEF